MQIKGIAVRLASGLIYTLVIASLMIHAVALALMADSALAAEPEVPDLNLKPLFDFLDMLGRSWLGTIKNFNQMLGTAFGLSLASLATPEWRSTSNEAELLKNT
jgi:hypothetical protein